MGAGRASGGGGGRARTSGGGLTARQREFQRATGVNPTRSSRAVANLTAGGSRRTQEENRIRRNRRGR